MILVMAATGMFGRGVVRSLAHLGQPVRATGRSLTSLSSIQGPGVELVPADMDDPKDLERLMDGVDRVLVNAPMDDNKELRERNIIQAMINTGQRPQIVLLTGGVDHDDSLGAAGQAVEQFMRDSGLPWTIVGPQTVMESNFLPFKELIQTDQMILSCVGTSRVGFVALQDVTDAFVAVLTAPTAEHDGCEYIITGPDAVCFSDVAAAASQALDREIVYQDMPRDAFRQLMLEEAGFTPETVDLGVMCHLDAFRAGKARRVTTDFQRLTRRQPTSVQQWWCQHAAMFLSDPESQDRA